MVVVLETQATKESQICDTSELGLRIKLKKKFSKYSDNALVCSVFSFHDKNAL